MRPAALALLLAAWLAASAGAVAWLQVSPLVLGVAWPAGILAAASLAWRGRDPRHRSDPASRLEAQRRARDRFEADRLRRAGDDGLTARERREREAAARAEARAQARVEELRKRRRR